MNLPWPERSPRRRSLVAVSLAVTALAVALPRCGDGARAETAGEVLARLRQLENGPRKWTDRTQRVRLRIRDAAGKERVRELESFAKREGGGEEKALIVFRAPPELQGMGFLQWAHRDREDEQWLYLSALKRVRPISAAAKNESFAGTDFSYRELEVLNELTHWSQDEAAASVGADETIGKTQARVLTLRPRDAATMGYAHLRAWLRRDDLVLLRVEFVGPGGLLKQLDLEDIRDIGGIPTPCRLEMRTLATGGHTVIEALETAYDRGLADALFTQQTLERGGP